MSNPQKADGSVPDAVNKTQLPNDEIENNFLTSWKLGNIKEDVLDFSSGSVSRCRKNRFNLEKLDMDFSFDGGFEKFSSFQVDMSDLDFSTTTRMGQNPKERKGKQSEEEKVDQTSETFTFNFNFNELDAFDLSPSPLEKKGDSGKHSLDTRSDLPQKQDQPVENKLPESIVFTPENKGNDYLFNLGNGPISCSKTMGKSTSISETTLEVENGTSSHEEIPNAAHTIGNISLRPKTNTLAGSDEFEKTECLKQELVAKCSVELETPQTMADLSFRRICGNDSIHQNLQLSDFVGHAGPSSGEEDFVIKGSSGSLLKSAIPSNHDSSSHFPSNRGSIERSEKFECVKEELVGKCSTEPGGIHTLAAWSLETVSPTDAIHETDQLPDSGISSGPGSGKRDSEMKSSAGSVLKSSISSKLEALKHFPPKCATEAKSIKSFQKTADIDVQGPKLVSQINTDVINNLILHNRQKMQEKCEPSNISQGKAVDANHNQQKDSLGKNSPYFLQKSAPKQIHGNNVTVGIMQGDNKSNEKPGDIKLGSLPRAEKDMSSLSANHKNEKDCNSVGHAFSLFSRVRVDGNELITTPKSCAGGTPDFGAAPVHLPEQKESSSLHTIYNGCALPCTAPVTNCKDITEDKGSMLETEKRPHTLSAVKLSRMQKEPKLFSPSKGNLKVDLGASLKKTNASIPEITMFPNLSMKRKSVQGPSMRELTKSPLKHIIESPLLESRKRLKDSQIIEQKQVLDTENAQHNLLSVPSVSLKANIPDLEVSKLVEDDSTVQKVQAYAKEIDDISKKLRKMNEEAKEVFVRAIVNNNFLLLLNQPVFDEKIFNSELGLQLVDKIARLTFLSMLAKKGFLLQRVADVCWDC